MADGVGDDGPAGGTRTGTGPAGERRPRTRPLTKEEAEHTLSEYDTGSDLAFAPEGRVPGWLRPLLVYQRGVDRLTDAVGSVVKYLVIAVIVVGFGNAVLRYAGQLTRTQLTSNRYLELQWYLYATLFLLAFASILKHGVNVRVDFWYERRSERTKAWIDLVGHLIGLLPFCAIALWIAWPQVLRSWGRSPDGTWRTWQVWEIWENSPDPGGLARAPIKTMLLVGFGLLLLQGVAEVVKLVAVLTGHGHVADRARAQHSPVRVE